MNIVYLGAPITVNLSVGQTIAINTTGTAAVECVSGLGLTAGATIGSIHGSATYGPFSAVGVARITATVRDGAYEVSDGQPIPIDTALAASGQTVLDDASRATLGNSISIFSPPTSDTAGILIAAYAAKVAGGGLVQLPDAAIALDAPIPLYNGVKYRGAAKVVTFPGIPDGRMIPSSGTILTGNGTFPAFALNDSDLASPLANSAAFSSAGVVDCGISDVILDGFSFGVKAGAKYNPSCWWSAFERIKVLNSTQWGVWFENFQHCVFNDIITIDGAVGQQHLPADELGKLCKSATIPPLIVIPPNHLYHIFIYHCFFCVHN